jgi:hypothetical protein
MVNDEKFLETVLFSALEKDDLKLANFIYKAPFMLEESSSSFDDFDFNELLKSKCREGNLSTLKYICENEIIPNDSPIYLFELISIACINGHLKVAKFLLTQLKKFNIFRTDSPSDETMKIVYSKVLKNGHQKEAKWLSSNFDIDLDIDIDDYFEKEEIWDENDEEENDEEENDEEENDEEENDEEESD